MRTKTQLLLFIFLITGAHSQADEESLYISGEPRNFRKVTEEQIAKINYLHEQAQVFIEHQQFRKAIEYFEKIIMIEPDDDSAYTNMGQCYLSLSDEQNAKQAFENALDINSENMVAYAGLARIADPDADIDFDEIVKQSNEED